MEDIKNIQYDLSHLHDLSGSAINFKANQSNKMVGTVVSPKESAPPAENMVNKSNSSSASPVPSAPPANNNNPTN